MWGAEVTQAAGSGHTGQPGSQPSWWLCSKTDVIPALSCPVTLGGGPQIPHVELGGWVLLAELPWLLQPCVVRRLLPAGSAWWVAGCFRSGGCDYGFVQLPCCVACDLRCRRSLGVPPAPASSAGFSEGVSSREARGWLAAVSAGALRGPTSHPRWAIDLPCSFGQIIPFCVPHFLHWQRKSLAWKLPESCFL